MEMGGKVMSFGLPPWDALIFLSGFVLLGGVGGAFYFRAIWRSALALAGGAGPGKTLAFMLGRLILLGALLAVASRHGAGPLLATAAGVLVARAGVTRRLKETRA
jgi:hypothetical protein